MIEQTRQIILGIVLGMLSFLKPIEGELSTLFLIFMMNFFFGYISGMIANGEDWNIKKAIRCLGEAAIFFLLCASIYAVGKFKEQEAGAIQTVSLVTYLIIYFYSCNVLRNCKKIFRENTAPWYVVSVLYWFLRFKFIESIPLLNEYLNTKDAKGHEETH